MFGEILLAAILASSAPPERVEAELGKLPQCAAAAPFDTSVWTPTQYQKFDILLPAGMKADEKAQFVHGGRLWTDGTRDVALTFGHWGRDSFGPGKMCRTKIGDVDAFVFESVEKDGTTTVVVWYLLGNGEMEPIINATSRRKADRELLHAIARSLSAH